MIKDLVETFRKPSALQLAQRELEEAQRELLQAHTAQEWAASEVAYHAARIKRLKHMLAAEATTEVPGVHA
jgi:hypothetical protein